LECVCVRMSFSFWRPPPLGAVYAGSEALARGGGGGRGGHGGHSGMSSSLHGLSSHGMHGMSGHGPHSPFKGHSHGMHNIGQNKHHHMMAQGQGHGQKGANMPGVWHKVSSNGNHGKGNNARDFRRKWQSDGAWAGGGGWSGDGGAVGTICINSGVCQGVWQVAPQTQSRASQSRSFRKDWQVDGEL
jgi:hypothetical protein